MGRWTRLFRHRQPRYWMRASTGLPAGLDVRSGRSVPATGNVQALVAAAGIATVATVETASGVVEIPAPRGPLRRNVGVPEPRETPLFVHEEALARERDRRAAALRKAALVGSILVVAVLAAQLTRLLADG